MSDGRCELIMLIANERSEPRGEDCAQVAARKADAHVLASRHKK